MNIYVDSSMNDEDRRRELYRGSIFVHSPCPSALNLCGLAQELIEEAFRPTNPLKVQEILPAEKCAEILAVLKPKFIHHPKAKKYLGRCLPSWDATSRRPISMSRACAQPFPVII